MSVTATGMFSKPLANMEDLLAGLSAFQTWTAEETAEAAATHVYRVQFDEPDQAGTTDAEWAATRAAVRPVCIVGFGDITGGEEDAVASYWHKTGSLIVLFEEIAQNETGPQSDENPVETKDAITHLMNNVGTIVAELEAAVTGGGHIDLTGWTLHEAPGRMASEDVAGGQLDIAACAIQFDRRDM